MNQTICVSNLRNVDIIESFGLANQDARPRSNGKRLHAQNKCTHSTKSTFKRCVEKLLFGCKPFSYHLEDKLAVCFMNCTR